MCLPVVSATLPQKQKLSLNPDGAQLSFTCVFSKCLGAVAKTASALEPKAHVSLERCQPEAACGESPGRRRVRRCGPHAGCCLRSGSRQPSPL
ncbi:unnamed protein product [Rangifer tarandus platyrhynchus]|uniref:Uncharacterized protein n=2 Tax=Rangifer tarandus platyrhynchus TaxID=3082113 RepID=A0ACB0DXZ2_RANTA|nr:unnamed protein product [Rangifer tarandus platyrhynchus]CAI9693212.1 unnamed protein product [Rangifer tarandus platyrhynchus]